MAKQKQGLSQRMKMNLSPSQLQVMRMIEIPVMCLHEEIEQKILENPALEKEDDNFNEPEEVAVSFSEDPDYEEDNDFSIETFPENESVNDFAEEFFSQEVMEDSAIEIGANYPSSQMYNPDRFYEPVAVVEDSLLDSLTLQLSEMHLTPKEAQIAAYIIGNIDQTGYLRMDNQTIANDLLVTYNIKASGVEIENIITTIIHELDPPGIGARDPREYFLIQLNHKENNDIVRLAKIILENFFEEYSKKHYDKIIKKLNINKKEFQQVHLEIQNLTPRPAIAETSMEEASVAITPDFTVVNENGNLQLFLNNDYLPKLRINPLFYNQYNYFKENKSSAKLSEDEKFIKDNVENALDFIDILHKRELTLYKTVSAMVQLQKSYFLSGNEENLKPMILQDVADIIQMDVSTVSRVSNGKYVQTDFGTIPLKKLFSEALGDKKVSSREVKKILKDIIDAENKNKPLKDEELADILKKKGYQIARRTVVKYREELEIPVARLRKDF